MKSTIHSPLRFEAEGCSSRLRGKVANDPVWRTGRLVICPGRDDLLATSDALQAHLAQQTFDRAAGNLDVVTFEPAADLPGSGRYRKADRRCGRAATTIG